MIGDWRDRKGMGDFSFLVVSLPPSVATGTPAAQQANTGRPEIRLGELEGKVVNRLFTGVVLRLILRVCISVKLCKAVQSCVIEY